MVIFITMSVFFVSDDEQKTNFESSIPKTLRELRYEEACNKLAVEAVKRGCTDNVTVLIIDIQNPPPPPSNSYI